MCVPFYFSATGFGRSVRTLIGPPGDGHVAQFLSDRIHAQTSTILSIVKNAPRTIRRTGIDLEDLAFRELEFRAAVVVTIRRMPADRLPSLLDECGALVSMADRR